MHRLFAIAAIFLAGCASIIHGTSQEINIASSPSGAKISVDNEAKGVTPMVASLKRKNQHIIKIQMDGYAPFEAIVAKKASGWVWGNLAFGGLIGLAVDAISGGMYKLTPDQISGQLAKQSVATTVTKDGLYVFLVKTPQPEWEKIGELAAAK